MFDLSKSTKTFILIYEIKYVPLFMVQLELDKISDSVDDRKTPYVTLTSIPLCKKGISNSVEFCIVNWAKNIQSEGSSCAIVVVVVVSLLIQLNPRACRFSFQHKMFCRLFFSEF